MYGMPAGEAFEASERGELALAGCVIMHPDDNLARWACPSCARWWTEDGRLSPDQPDRSGVDDPTSYTQGER
jgi:hypothetical protein